MQVAQSFLPLALLGLLALSFSGCSNAEDSPPSDQLQTGTETTGFQNLWDTPWRMIESNDATLTDLDRYNFKALKVSDDNTGAFYQFAFGSLIETPLATVLWSIPSSGVLNLTLSKGPGFPPIQLSFSYTLENAVLTMTADDGTFYRYEPLDQELP